jgi:CheY-like chemotaxis protein
VEVRVPVAVQGRHRRGVGRRVLLVDDIAVTRQISAAMLTRMGAEVTTAENGQEALEVLRATEFALVLMDLRMPVMGGLEASRLIRAGEAGAERSDVPVVALTAHSAAGDADRSLLAGMDAHLTKPFTFDELRSTVLLYAPELADPFSPG